jgi:hypothetical protein
MKSVVALATVLWVAGLHTAPALGKGKGKGGGGDADPNAAVARAHGGHVWVRSEPLPSSDGSRLGSWLGAHPPKAAVETKAKDTPWSINYIAVFKKPALKGAMTVQFVEKGDAKGFVDQYSPDNGSSSTIFRGTYDLSPDQGFNKGHTYVIKVGQLLKGKFVLYATGEVSLK